MLKLILLALAVCGLSVSAAFAQNANFELFRRICIEPHASRDAVLAAAKAEGFVRPPAGMLSAMGSSMKIDNLEIRAKFVEDGLELMFVGQKAYPLSDKSFTASVCVLGVMPTDPAEEAAVTAWAGVAPASTSSDGSPIVLFSDDGGHHKAVDPTNQAAIADMVRNGQLRFVIAGHQDQESLAMFGVITP